MQLLRKLPNVDGSHGFSGRVYGLGGVLPTFTLRRIASRWISVMLTCVILACLRGLSENPPMVIFCGARYGGGLNPGSTLWGWIRGGGRISTSRSWVQPRFNPGSTQVQPSSTQDAETLTVDLIEDTQKDSLWQAKEKLGALWGGARTRLRQGRGVLGGTPNAYGPPQVQPRFNPS